MKSTNLTDLLLDGFSEKYAKYYLEQAGENLNVPVYDKEYIKWALSQGFLADSAYWYGLDEHNTSDYLTDYDYYRIWPLNDWARIWVNDKLTLKHLLNSSEFGSIMPDYYYYTSKEGLIPLEDCPKKTRVHTVDDFISVLMDVKDIACKPCNGTCSLGFYKLSANDEKHLLINDQLVTRAELENFIYSHNNYVFTEYLRPGGYLKCFGDKIHTLRIVVVNPVGCEPKIIGGYVRIPSEKCGMANYLHLEGDFIDDYNIVTDIDPLSGNWGNAKSIYVNRAVDLQYFPKTDLPLKGTIEGFDVVRQTVLGISDRFRNIEYMGFDLCVSTNGIKCMEINTHPGIRHMQIFKSLFSDQYTREYFERKIAAVDSLCESDKIKRNLIIR